MRQRLPHDGGAHTFAHMRSYVAVLLFLSSSWVWRTELVAPRDSHSYLFVWAGDSAGKRSDFLAVIDADTASATYGRIMTTVPTGAIGMPHHTEHELWTNGHLLANDFHLGRTWLFDLNDALHPRVLASFGDLAGFSHPHTFIRLRNGEVLATFQYRAENATSAATEARTSKAGMSMAAIDRTGRRIVLNSAGHGSRLFVIDFAPEIGQLKIDGHFRDAGSSQAGVSMSKRAWPGGFTATAVPHGSVFSR